MGENPAAAGGGGRVEERKTNCLTVCLEYFLWRGGLAFKTCIPMSEVDQLPFPGLFGKVWAGCWEVFASLPELLFGGECVGGVGRAGG